jgi:hypothetical protein
MTPGGCGGHMAECWPEFKPIYCPKWRSNKDRSFWCQLAFNTECRTPIYVLIRLAELTEYVRNYVVWHHLP